MSRKKRQWYPGATYHVMSRGNRKTALFKEPSDYLSFLECIQRVQKEYGFKIHSLCLMTNHFHVLIETEGVALWKIMQKILHSYSMNFNRKYSYTGHLFESRYTACLIEDERYFLEVSRYIHLNPVKAMMVREPLAYDYSSYREFVKNKKAFPDDDEMTQKPARHRDPCKKLIKAMVDTSRVLRSFRNRREQYRIFVESKMSHEEQEMLIRKDIMEDDHWLPWEKTKREQADKTEIA